MVLHCFPYSPALHSVLYVCSANIMDTSLELAKTWLATETAKSHSREITNQNKRSSVLVCSYVDFYFCPIPIGNV